MTRGHRLTDLQTRRIAAGLSVTALAKAANVSDLTIRQLENGGNCDEYVTDRILAALGSAVGITDSSVANPSVITTEEAHPFVSGDTVEIADHADSTPDINGERVATVTGADTFTIPVNVSVGGTGGTAALASASLGLVALR